MTTNYLLYPEKFAQASGPFSRYTEKDLGDIVRRIVRFQARNELNRVPTDLTNNAGGVVSALLALSAQAASVAAFSAGTNDAAGKSTFDAALVAFLNQSAAFVEHLNRINGRLGLPMIDVSAYSSKSFTVNTVGALTQSVTGVSSGGTNSVEQVSANARLAAMRRNMAKLTVAVNRIASSCGAMLLSGDPGDMTVIDFSASRALVLEDVPATATGVDGTNSTTVAKATVDPELVKIANNMTTMVAHIIDLVGALPADVTDSSGGTASLTTTTANPLPVAAAGAATTSAPKAGFDTVLGIINEDVSELATRINLLLRRANLGTLLLVDNTGATVDGTISAITNALVAVDGSSGTSAVDQASARARMTTAQNNLSSLLSAANALAAIYGERQIVDAIGGTVSTTLAAITATATGVGGGGNVTLLNADVNTWLGNHRNNVATIAALLNRMTNSTNDVPAIGAVAINL